MVSIFCNDNDIMISQYSPVISQDYVNGGGLTDLSPSSRRGDPEPDGVDRDAEHGAAGHEVSDSVGPPGVVVVLVDQVLPGDQLEEEDASADGRGDDGPAAHKEVAGVVANHVVEGQSEPPEAR